MVRSINNRYNLTSVSIVLSCVLIFAMLILNFSCSKTDIGDEHCPEGYRGNNCDVQITPDTVFVTKINVTRFPATNSIGENWDSTSNADIFVEIWKNNEHMWTSSLVRQNALADTNHYFIPSDTIALTDPMAQYAIHLYDQDEDEDYDYIGGLNFISYTNDNGFPELMILDERVEVAFELSLEYSW